MESYGLKEIFQFAKQMEENGRLYYETAAAECNDPSLSSLCLKIADQETEHLEKLKSMEQTLLTDEEMQELTWEELTWLQFELEDAVDLDMQELKSFIKEATILEILLRAIQMESDTMAFYSSLMPEVNPDCAGLLQELIEEENNHLKWLTEAKVELEK